MSGGMPFNRTLVAYCQTDGMKGNGPASFCVCFFKVATYSTVFQQMSVQGHLTLASWKWYLSHTLFGST
eukprot:187283-Amphidinium_carterae.1